MVPACRSAIRFWRLDSEKSDVDVGGPNLNHLSKHHRYRLNEVIDKHLSNGFLWLF